VAATWFERSTDDTTTRHLVEAARHYEAGRFDALVVPANIAVEAAVTATVSKAIAGSFANKERTKDFLSKGATYSYQLDVLLRMVAFMCQAPTIPSHILQPLHELRRLRNEVGHGGVARNSVPKSEAAEMLTAAIFGVRYAETLWSKVDEAKTSGRLPPLASG
jgi:hypothetical protein